MTTAARPRTASSSGTRPSAPPPVWAGSGRRGKTEPVARDVIGMGRSGGRSSARALHRPDATPYPLYRPGRARGDRVENSGDLGDPRADQDAANHGFAA